MKRQSRRTLCAAGLITAALASGAFAQQQEEKLGTLSFPTSCDPKVQAEFERGVAMIHSYWFLVARRVFEGVLQQDPGCAIAYWGIAMDLLGNSLGAPPSRENANAAWAALEKAREIGAKTDRERGWIDAIRAYYRDHDKTDVETRLRTYNSAMEQMAQRYPDDYEVQVFYALTLQASASKTDMSYGNQLKSVAILEKLFEQNPQHPGVSHFIIHAYDFPPLAERGIAAAKRYGGIAPAVPHARHMPSHIYSMVGMWEESIASNTSAMEIQPDYYHAADFTVYAHLQLAQDVKAKALIDKAIATPPRGDRPIEAMKALRTALQRADQSYWADRTEEQMLAISAWIAAEEGARDQAVRFMRAAADGEDGSIKNVIMENRLYPLREMLAELLLEVGQPAPALEEYETALKHTPNRYRAFFGAARASDAVGNRAQAAEYFGKLVNLAKNADAERQEVREAKAFLARR